jgi:HCOMODA/2-hydroxy-3-carboxy-muconic semialdehyde decarboxylase
MSAIGPPLDPAILDDLVTGNRILAHLEVVDGFGHLSARHDKRPDRFFLARSMAPGQVTAADIMEFDLDGTMVDPQGRTPYLERFIHGEIYRRRADVGAVAHSHSPSVIPFTATAVPLRPVYHMAAFLGPGAPVFEIRETAGEGSDMLITDAARGRDLAETLGGAAVALMRGHGFVAAGPDLRTAVMYAAYTELGARVQGEALKLGQVTYLTPAEAAAAAAANAGAVGKAWEHWTGQLLDRAASQSAVRREA